MALKEILQNVEVFAGLTDDELEAVSAICQERQLKRGDVIAVQGQPGNDLYIITAGFVAILLETPKRVVANLGPGQIIGEIALIDQGPRTATVKAVENPTVVQVISRKDFDQLCREKPNIGYLVIKNIATDLSFKLRHRNLTER